MRKLTLFLFLTFFSAMTVTAQRYCVVDVNLVLENMDEYQQAQQELDRIAATWRQEIAEEYDEIKSLYNKYQAEQVLLSEEARQEREEEIMNREKAVRELQKEKFGPEGALFRKRKELVQPIQEKVYRTIEEYAAERAFDFVFDKGGNSGIIYSNNEYDKTRDILNRLGIRK